MNPTTTAPARIKVFWQPGCTSCLRTKEFLTKQGIEFESINVHNNPAGMAELQALGARSVPVVALAGRYTLCQSFGDVIKFLDLKARLMDPLPPEQLVEKITMVLEALARFAPQFSETQLREVFRDRDRTAGNTAYHAIRVAEMGLQASQGVELRYESFFEQAPPHWQSSDIARWALEVRDQYRVWWQAQKAQDPLVNFKVSTYYGQRPMHDVLERTAWHAAQHTRQVMLMLESHGIEPLQPLTMQDFSGLPVPDEAWG
jgi:glutaredoxin